MILKIMFSKKATKIEEIFTVDLTVCSKCQIDGEDFVKFCRKHELYNCTLSYSKTIFIYNVKYCNGTKDFAANNIICLYLFAEVVVTRTDIPEYPEIHPMYSDPWHPHLSTDHSYIYSFPNLSLPPNFHILLQGKAL